MKQAEHKTVNNHRAQTMRIHSFPFTGKERDEETGYGYFGARYMDHELMAMWLSVDPLADKYPSISPYAYCAWNPVRLVDPDGRKIRFGATATRQQIAYFYQAVRFLDNHDCGGRFGQLKASRFTYTIQFVDDINQVRYDPNTKTIYWAPTIGLKTDLGVILSPSTVLNHEMTHATRDDDIKILLQIGAFNEYHKQRKKHEEQTEMGSSGQYDTKEDEEIINGIERRTALQLGEIEDGQYTRLNHKGNGVEVSDPTSHTKLLENEER